MTRGKGAAGRGAGEDAVATGEGVATGGSVAVSAGTGVAVSLAVVGTTTGVGVIGGGGGGAVNRQAISKVDKSANAISLFAVMRNTLPLCKPIDYNRSATAWAISSVEALPPRS